MATSISVKRFGATVTVLAALSLPIYGLPSTVAHPQDSAAAATVALADDLAASIKREAPEIGTFLGLPDAEHGRIADNSLQARARRRAEEDEFRKRFAAIDGRALEGRPEGVIHGFLAYALETGLATRVCEEELWNVNQIAGWQTLYSEIARVQPIDTPEQRDQALARFRALATFADREISNLREGLQKGYSAPRTNVEQVITQMSGFVAEDSPFFSPASRTKVSSFATAWRQMFSSEVVPAFRRYEVFLRDEYLPRARQDVGVSALPNGAACYRTRLAQMTTLNVTPEEVHKTGLAELERIQSEERAIVQQLFKSDDLNHAFAQLDRSDYRWDTREAVIAHARKATERAQGAMSRWFGRLPKTAVIVTPIPAVEEPTAADRYQAGTIDGKRPGEYQINGGRWVGQRKSDLEAVVFHETIPGHHLEVTLSLERPDAHLVTKLVGNPAFSEGWGSYAERLADEMKLYSSEIDRLGMWQSRAYRAARLVVDTGIHAFGWPRQRAIDL